MRLSEQQDISSQSQTRRLQVISKINHDENHGVSGQYREMDWGSVRWRQCYCQTLRPMFGSVTASTVTLWLTLARIGFRGGGRDRQWAHLAPGTWQLQVLEG